MRQRSAEPRNTKPIHGKFAYQLAYQEKPKSSGFQAKKIISMRANTGTASKVSPETVCQAMSVDGTRKKTRSI